MLHISSCADPLPLCTLHAGGAAGRQGSAVIHPGHL